MTTTTLTRDELQELSGLRRPRAIARWLQRQGWPCVVGADGWPRVLRSVALARLGEARHNESPRLRLP